jgi:hypothetical protein
MAPGGAEQAGVMRAWPLFVLPLLLGGCESLNNHFVRTWMQDQELGERVHQQIRRGLERRQAAPEPTVPSRPAPAFLDQG